MHTSRYVRSRRSGSRSGHTHGGGAILRGVRLNPDGEAPDVGVPRRLAASMTIGEQQEWLRRYLGRHRVSRRTALRGRRERAGRARRHDRALGVRGVRAGGTSTPVGVIGRHLSFGSDPRSADGDRGRADRQAGGAGRSSTSAPTPPTARTLDAEVRELREHGAAAGRRHPRRGAVLRPRLRRRPRARRPGALPVPPRGRHDHPRRGVHHRSRAGTRWRRSRSPRSPTRA